MNINNNNIIIIIMLTIITFLFVKTKLSTFMVHS